MSTGGVQKGPGAVLRRDFFIIFKFCHFLGENKGFRDQDSIRTRSGLGQDAIRMRSGCDQDSIRTVWPRLCSDKFGWNSRFVSNCIWAAAVLFVPRKFLSANFLSPLGSLDKAVFISGD